MKRILPVLCMAFLYPVVLCGQQEWSTLEIKPGRLNSMEFSGAAEEYQLARDLWYWFEKGGESIRPLAFKALAGWNSKEVLPVLHSVYRSGNKTYESKAFAAFRDHMRRVEYPKAQRLLLYRKWLKMVKQPEEQEVLTGMTAGLESFPAFVTLGELLEVPELRTTAARGVRRILAGVHLERNRDFHGAYVRDVTARALSVLKSSGERNEYRRLLRLHSRIPHRGGFVPLFNGTDLEGWQGLVGNPITRDQMSEAELKEKQVEANRQMYQTWSVKNEAIWFTGKGDNLCTVKEYGDFELLVDWLITKGGDSGIYLRGTPQVQIWDTSRVEVGAQVGSGGLYNNQNHPSTPSVVADNPVDDWNTFRIRMTGERVSVWLNGIQVVDQVVMENYWDRSIPIFPREAIELQAHGTNLGFRNIFIREMDQ